MEYTEEQKQNLRLFVMMLIAAMGAIFIMQRIG
jgi:hypothetical protein